MSVKPIFLIIVIHVVAACIVIYSLYKSDDSTENVSMNTWIEEYRRLSEELSRYADPINHKVFHVAGAHPLSENEEIFHDLYYYWNAALVNSHDVFGYVHYIIEHKHDFEAIGAHGTLQALEGLMPFYLEQQTLSSDEAENYWHLSKEQRSNAENMADDVLPFAELLLRFAHNHL